MWSNPALVEHLRPCTPMVSSMHLCYFYLDIHTNEGISIYVIVKARVVNNKLNWNVTEMNPCEIK